MLAATTALAVAVVGEHSSTKTIVVEEKPIVLANASRTPVLSAQDIYERDASGVVAVSPTDVSKTPSTAELVKGEVVSKETL